MSDVRQEEAFGNEKELAKQEFKDLYFKYSTFHNGWTEDYWNQFYEHEEDKTYFFDEPDTPDATRMFIESDGDKRRMYFLTEDAEESFFYFPGKDD